MRDRSWAVGWAAFGTSFVLLAACDRPRAGAPSPPEKTNLMPTIMLAPVDKIDLLVDVDNSSAMADKQKYLTAAIPELVDRLASPNCLDASGLATGQRVDASGACPNGSTAEFRTIRDVHVAVISSSLGSRGGDVCDPTSSPHADDRGELRGSSASGEAPNLNLGEDGCGVESQLESWYRFLIQPDPYDSIVVNTAANPTVAAWSGVDANVIRERHDFLRPDSLVVIVTLSDENDSEIDARSISGTGYQFLTRGFNPPRATQQCVNPDDPECTSCGFPGNGDPSCPALPPTKVNPWLQDPNLRHVKMKQKYGIDAQFPIDRYLRGLTQTKIADRNGEYPGGAGSYVGNANCTNPLFAASLPDGSALDAASLCDLPDGLLRTPDRIFFMTIGGVPNQLLHYDPNNAAATTLSTADWTKILGSDPERFDFTGIDPHMIESYLPRAGLAGPSSANDADAISGREWVTDSTGSIDLESACIFPLASPRDCTNPQNAASCECPTSSATPPQATAIPPWCDATNPTKQIAARAVPTPRQLLLAQKLGPQGVAASICPIHSTAEIPSDPLFGVRPAMATLLARLSPLLR